MFARSADSIPAVNYLRKQAGLHMQMGDPAHMQISPLRYEMTRFY